ncbi:hypothetical protein ABIA00_002571 [Bradyrhizobium ottawaense]
MPVSGIILLDQRLGKLGGERIAEQHEVIEPVGRNDMRRKMIRGDVDVQEGAWRLELHAERFRRSGDIERPCRHGAVENDLTVPCQLRARGLQGDADEIAIVRRRRFVRRAAPRVLPSRDRDVLGRAVRSAIDLTPLALPGDHLRGANNLVIPRAGWKIDPGMRRVQIVRHRSSSPGSAAVCW